MAADQFQREFLGDTIQDGKCVVLKACAGSGKTFSIVEKMKLISDKHDSGSIVAISFSNISARELKNRLKKRIPNNNICVGTIHSFSFYLLKELFDYKQHTILTEWKSILIIRECIACVDDNFKNFRKTELNNLAKGFLSEYNKYRSTQSRRGIQTEVFEKETSKKIILKYEEVKKEQQVLDYSDMLLVLHEKLKKQPEKLKEIQSKYKFFFIDEAQDLDGLQFDLILQLSRHGYTTFVGDIMQTIYKFRFAAPERFSETYMEKIFNTVATYSLRNNYRSIGNIVDMSNIVRNIGKDDLTSLSIRDKVKGGIKYIKVASNIQEGDKVAEIVKELLTQNTPDDIAIICRSNQYIKTIIEPALIRKKINYKLISRGTRGHLTDSVVANFYLNALSVTLNNRDIISIMDMAKHLDGVGSTFTDKIISLAVSVGIDNIYQHLGSRGEVSKLSRIENYIVDNLNNTFKRSEGNSFDFFLNELHHNFYSLFEIEASVFELETVRKTLSNWGKYYNEFYHDNGVVGLREILSHILNDINNFENIGRDDAVGVYTVHATKGAEFKNVIASGFTSIRPKADTHKDEHNILYVQITRSIDKIFIVDSDFSYVGDKLVPSYKNLSFYKLISNLGII